MIVSASRRTDIPALFSEWFMNRIRAGFCAVPNPYNPKQITQVDLTPAVVDAIVFWSKNPAPILQHVPELERAGYRFYFQFTLNAYPHILEPGIPPLDERIATFRDLARMIGPERVVWRYDPILFSNLTDWPFHREAFARLSGQLAPSTRRVVISLMDVYRKTQRRFQELRGRGVELIPNADEKPETEELLRFMAATARGHGLEIFTCAEPKDYSYLGIPPGACIDGRLIERLWGLRGEWGKDPGQREACGCVLSRDIGINGTCTLACPYCYATPGGVRS